jgi:RNA polymerase sigma-70 factor (ECF subfamily)
MVARALWLVADTFRVPPLPSPVPALAAPLSPVSPDRELVVAMSRGDRFALGQLYDRYAGLLLAIGARMLRNVGEAEEVLQEVFVEAFRSAHAYDAARGTVRAWLTTRMRSRTLDRIKSAGRSRAVGLDDVPETRVSTAPVAPTGDEERLRAAMESLPGEQRVVIELAYFDGLSSTEIAERVGVPVGTVKSRTAAAMGKLRSALGAA